MFKIWLRKVINCSCGLHVIRCDIRHTAKSHYSRSLSESRSFSTSDEISTHPSYVVKYTTDGRERDLR